MTASTLDLVYALHICRDNVAGMGQNTISSSAVHVVCWCLDIGDTAGVTGVSASSNFKALRTRSCAHGQQHCGNLCTQLRADHAVLSLHTAAGMLVQACKLAAGEEALLAPRQV